MDSDSITKHDALQRISDLAKTHSLTLDEIGACLTIKATRHKGSSWLVRLLGYLSK
jgi:hypothetical protein